MSKKTYSFIILTIMLGMAFLMPVIVYAIDNFPGTALDFDGVNDSISFGNDSSLDIENNITIETWLKTGEMNTNRDILRKGNICLLYWDDSYETVSGKGL